jgi:Rrf2 family transcriptional regulator, iron-sulfur cluster assembly transcription factor
MKSSLAEYLSYPHDVRQNPSPNRTVWLSSTARQALHAVVCIAGSADEGPVRVDEIAAVMECPRNYLSKTLHILTRAGVLRSERGPKGGFRLSTSPDRLTLARVIAPFEPVSERQCLVGRARCSDARPCAAHGRWAEVAGRVNEFFTGTTIAMLLKDNPRAAEEARAVIRSVRRHSNPKVSHGSVA